MPGQAYPQTGWPAEGGFTLLEVLVALVIAATATSIILMHMRTLIDLSDRIRNHQTEISQLLNQAEGLALPDWGDTAGSKLEDSWIAITLREQLEPSVFVSNFEPGEREIAPIDRAYTPFQAYRVQPGKRYAMSLLYPNLPLEF